MPSKSKTAPKAKRKPRTKASSEGIAANIVADYCFDPDTQVLHERRYMPPLRATVNMDENSLQFDESDTFWNLVKIAADALAESDRFDPRTPEDREIFKKLCENTDIAALRLAWFVNENYREIIAAATEGAPYPGGSHGTT